jgi:endonuclease/exonuclease/phosphatase family metal-dependent hydrolase
MGRDMLVTTCTFNSKPLTLVDTHLESGGEAAQQRVIQLNTALETLTTAQSGTATTKKAVILAGDLNLREKETKEVTRLKAVHDAWEITLGASNDREHKYTWDMQLNTNYEMQAAYKVTLSLHTLLLLK